MMKLAIGLTLVLCACPTLAGAVLEGKGGMVVIESESTSSKHGKWVEKKTVEGYTGEGHLEFSGNTPNSGPATSPLVYRFTVDKDGIYHLHILAHKRLVGEDGEKARGDQCNDCYVRLEGDYEAGGKAPKAILGKDTKLYVHGKSAESWDWTSKLDFHDEETGKATKQDPLYALKTGTTYTFTVSGRSQRFNMDRIVFHHTSVADSTWQAESASRSAP